MPKITIDGIECEVADGLNVIEAAKTIGIHIPHFCYHPALSLVGQCRMCLIELDPIPKLQTACSTFVKDGMVIRTNTEKVIKARKAIMEFLLINHPLDCPECDQAGECDLQNNSFEFGQGFSRFEEQKRTYSRDIPVGEKLVRIQDRCIHCTRCIRFFREIVQNEVMTYQWRGNNTAMTPLEQDGRRLDTNYSGNMHELCPCGALTLKDFRFKTRPWNLANTESVCPLCSTGCNIFIDHKQRKIFRIRPRVNMDVNTWWICDFGRIDFGYAHSETRIAGPRVKGADADWKTALDTAAGLLKTTGASATAILCSADATNEEALLVKKLAAALGCSAASLPAPGVDPLEMEDHLLLRADKAANTQGLKALGIVPDPALADKLSGGAIKTLLLINPFNKQLAAALDGVRDAVAKIPNLVVLDHNETDFSKAAAVVLPGAVWAEKNGTFTNYKGLVQRINQAFAPAGKARGDFDILLALAQGAGADIACKTHIDAYNEIRDDLLKLEAQIKKDIEALQKAAAEAEKA
jgi:NADH-quinone oxidoreductase subunit G